MDIADMPGAVCQAARVLEPGGRFCVCVTHPLGNASRFDGTEPDAPFTIHGHGSYLDSRLSHGTFERVGLWMTCHSRTHRLEDCARALEDAGFLIERVREPAAPPEIVAARESYRRWQRVPMFLHLRAIRGCEC